MSKPRASARPPGFLDQGSRATPDLAGSSQRELLSIVLDRRFGVEFQPVVDLLSGETVGHEALARFSDARGCPVPPHAVFALLHREPSLLLRVELETKRLALERAPAGPVYVNVDPDSFDAGGAPGENALLEALSASTRPVVVEAIETMSVCDAHRAGAMVRAVRARGLAVALDDVGAPEGLLSLDLLPEVDVLKLDRSWLARAQRPRDRAVLDAICSLARRLGTRTVLEGVETTAHLTLARDLRVGAVQGFLFRDRFRTSHIVP
jgi:EAL domain-containing protein (putative c-di-GMP-specific phosphodiesterase class I)